MAVGKAEGGEHVADSATAGSENATGSPVGVSGTRGAGVPGDAGPAVDVVVMPRREFFEADLATLDNDFRATLRRSTRLPRDGR